MTKRSRGSKKNNTWDSNVVPHRSTNQARTYLNSLSRREAVLSCWYGRSYLRSSHIASLTRTTTYSTHAHNLLNSTRYPTIFFFPYRTLIIHQLIQGTESVTSCSSYWQATREVVAWLVLLLLVALLVTPTLQPKRSFLSLSPVARRHL